jgi:hypothetical protein
VNDYKGVTDGRTWNVLVISDDGLTDALPHIVRHSPDGFCWGYHGSGPSELAHSLLVFHLGREVEPAVYHQFKSDIIASYPQDQGFLLTGEMVDAWLRIQEGRA